MPTAVPPGNEFGIARALALQVRLLTVDQITRCWFSHCTNPLPRAEQAIAKLKRSGLIERRIFEAHPFIRLTRPLFSWNPGDRNPTSAQLDDLADRLENRWKIGTQAIEAYIATKDASHIFGAFSDARHEKHSEATHDLHLANVFVRYHVKEQNSQLSWWGEAAFPKLGFEIKGMKDPDAFLLDGDGRAQRVVEFAGVYSAEHLTTFHAHCAGKAAAAARRRFAALESSALSQLYGPGGTSYELW